MFLKRIELNGFKSFCNKKEIIINKGITGVVGPNGSGKSNIADAMRWVLGEQSSKNLRGTSMQDVIFNGTQTRSKKGYCEVALVFDNTDMRIKSEYAEISIKRKMYRSGESDFSINNTNCRLKDILELFRDTGIGKEGYSIIGQGKIDEILNSKAVQRRKVFEEAAGIMKYRVRKEEAERNLLKTQDNITRIDDIIAELEAQVTPLELQMNEARDYLSMRDRLKDLEVNLFLYQYEKIDERLAKFNQQIIENEQEYHDTSELISQNVLRVSEIKKQLNTIHEEIEKYNVTLGEYASEQERLKGSINLVEEKSKNYQNSFYENEQKSVGFNKSIEENTKKVDDINKKITDVNTKIDEKYALILELRKTVENITGESDGFASSVEELKREVESRRVELQTQNIELNENQLKRDMILEKQENAQNLIEKHQEDTQVLKNKVDETQKELQDYVDDGVALRQKLNGITSNLSVFHTQKQDKTAIVAGITRKLNEDGSRFRLLSDMREELDGYFDSVKSLFKSAKNNREIADRIQGVLAEVVDVPKKYELPIEVILGNALQNVVVNTDADAKQIIDHLRKNNLGRVTFLPTQSLKTRYLQKEEKAQLTSDMCVASEAIICAEHIRPAVDFLLARTVIVPDMDSAIQLMRKVDYGFRVVTMQGDFIKPGGVITGGSLKNTKTGLLSRKRMTQELEENILLNQEILKKEMTAFEKITEGMEKAQKQQQEIMEQLRGQEIKSAETKQKLISAKQTLNEKEESFIVLQEQLFDSENDLKSILKNIEEISAFNQDKTAEFEQILENLAKAEAQITQTAQQTSAYKDALSALEIEQTELNNQKNMLNNEAEHLRISIKSAIQSSETLERQNQSHQAELKNASEVKKELQQQLDNLMQSIKNAGVLSQEKFEFKDRLNVQLDEVEQKSESLSVHKNELIEQKYKMIAAKEKMEMTKESHQNKMWDDYGLTYANALALKTEFTYQNSVKEIDEIREKMRNLGPVNPNAIEDFARVKERYDNLILQRDDLVSAGEDLKIVIDNLLSGMKESFKEKFALINENFMHVFKELFGGGHAELELLDDGDIMECGVEIIAEPPGKKLQNISLLSGGEKALTAIALLFAMLDINPSPICLLDEIDAPLDDANVIRFSDYLKKLSEDLQFILITHRKPSMAICDTLYGIAMQEKGVSDIVSVKLN
ncbi:MAG: chromosome segregation protein SMC [Christensenellaceae bacterium]